MRLGDKMKISKYIDWLMHMVGYALVLIIVSVIFQKTIYIDNSYFGLWGLIAVIIIFILNRTIKPLLVWLTLPLTALTLGFFYPLINILILKITDFILGSHFQIRGTFFLFIVSIIISIMNTIMDKLIINNLIKVRKK